MAIFRRVGVILLFVLGVVASLAAANINDPYLTRVAGTGNMLLAGSSIGVVAALAWRRVWRHRMGRVLLLLWCLPPVLMAGALGVFHLGRQEALGASAVEARELGPHFVVGYSSFEEVAVLAQRGLIGGIYLTWHNIRGRSADEMRREIDALQALRRDAGLPALTVAADQEGGVVNHLAPLAAKRPSLATLADLAPEQRQLKAEEFGRDQGRDLAALGVTLNLAPVLDLKPQRPPSRYDTHTRIANRAIASDPDVVTEIGRAYVHGLAEAGVGAAIKHFPGLGRIRTDTHHFAAHLDVPVTELEASDWRPFRDVLATSQARLMVAHIRLTAVDPTRAVSHSKAVVQGIIRDRWNYQGIIITDDMEMGAVYHYGICTAVVEALNAGVDQLLVAYDGAQFYRIFNCALDGLRDGRLDAAMLEQSKARLQRVLPAGEGNVNARSVVPAAVPATTPVEHDQVPAQHSSCRPRAIGGNGPVPCVDAGRG